MLTALGPVQKPLHSCAEPNWWIKHGKRAASESIWYGKSVKFDRVCRTFVELNLGSTRGAQSEYPQLDGFCCGIEQTERLYREVTDHNLGFHPQTQKLEPPRTA